MINRGAKEVLFCKSMNKKLNLVVVKDCIRNMVYTCNLWWHTFSTTGFLNKEDTNCQLFNAHFSWVQLENCQRCGFFTFVTIGTILNCNRWAKNNYKMTMILKKNYDIKVFSKP